MEALLARFRADLTLVIVAVGVAVIAALTLIP